MLKQDTGLEAHHLEGLLSFAMGFAERSQRLILDLWKGDLASELKLDLSPVTIVDKRVEELFRETVQRVYPSHGVTGEEYGQLNQGAEIEWIIDPIDGTQSLVQGIPTFGTLIGMKYQGEAVLGIIDIPVLKLRVYGGVGIGVKDNEGSAVNIVDIPSNDIPANEVMVTSTRATFGRGGGGELIQERIHRRFPFSRIYYDCFGHYLTVIGAVGGCYEYRVRSWDLIATEALINAAGGKCTYVQEQCNDDEGFYTMVFGKPKVVDALIAV